MPRVAELAGGFEEEEPALFGGEQGHAAVRQARDLGDRPDQVSGVPEDSPVVLMSPEEDRGLRIDRPEAPLLP